MSKRQTVFYLKKILKNFSKNVLKTLYNFIVIKYNIIIL